MTLFIYFCLCWVFVAAQAFSLAVVWKLLIAVASLIPEKGLWACRLQYLWHIAQQLQLPGSRAQTQWLGHADLAAPWHVFLDQGFNLCLGRQMLYH